jgi:hypothetical protein
MVQSMEQNRGLYFVNSAEEANQKGNEALNAERLEDAVQVPFVPTSLLQYQCLAAWHVLTMVFFLSVLHKWISYS